MSETGLFLMVSVLVLILIRRASKIDILLKSERCLFAYYLILAPILGEYYSISQDGISIFFFSSFVPDYSHNDDVQFLSFIMVFLMAFLAIPKEKKKKRKK